MSANPRGNTTLGPATHLVIMGVSGSGKTTLAQELSQRLGLPYAEADEFHPQSNIDKMSQGTPLTDEDRWPWLAKIRDWMTDQATDGDERGSIVTCSALKRSYRDLLREAQGDVIFLHVYNEPEIISERMAQRADHFMPPSLLPSQLKTLEPLGADEPGAVIPNDGSIDALVQRALSVIGAQGQANPGANAGTIPAAAPSSGSAA